LLLVLLLLQQEPSNVADLPTEGLLLSGALLLLLLLLLCCSTYRWHSISAPCPLLLWVPPS
jgi:hypothetical protein